MGTVRRTQRRGCHGVFTARGPHAGAALRRGAAAPCPGPMQALVSPSCWARLSSGSGHPPPWLAGWGALCEGCPPRAHGSRGAPAAPLPALSPPQVVLAALWLAAGESQPPRCRERAVLQGQWVPVQPPARPRRHITRPPCPAGKIWIEGARQCCTQCPAGESRPARMAWHGAWHRPGSHAPCHPTVPAGTFLSIPCTSQGSGRDCLPCPAGTFRTQPNTFTKCQACYECDLQGELCRAVPCRAVPHSAVPLTACLLQLSRPC